MSAYVYRVTAKRVKCSDGKEANVAMYAYKPTYSGWDSDKANNKMAFRSGCHSSERLAETGRLTDRVVFETAAGEKVFGNPNNYGTFFDDCTIGTANMPRLDGVTVA